MKLHTQNSTQPSVISLAHPLFEESLLSSVSSLYRLTCFGNCRCPAGGPCTAYWSTRLWILPMILKGDFVDLFYSPRDGETRQTDRQRWPLSSQSLSFTFHSIRDITRFDKEQTSRDDGGEGNMIMMLLLLLLLLLYPPDATFMRSIIRVACDSLRLYILKKSWGKAGQRHNK